MGISVLFINCPFSAGDSFSFGIENQDAVDEFGQLFNIPSMNDLVRCKLPDKQKLSTLQIKSKELKNILDTYADREILFNPEKGYTIPSKIYTV